jgi:hypothetical protein
MSAILKRHCYHSNGNDGIFVNNFQLLEDCSIYVVQFLSSNKKPLFKILYLNHDFVIFQKLYWATLSDSWCVRSGVYWMQHGVAKHGKTDLKYNRNASNQLTDIIRRFNYYIFGEFICKMKDHVINTLSISLNSSICKAALCREWFSTSFPGLILDHTCIYIIMRYTV